MKEQPILVEINDGYHTITLNRPDRLNAFTETLHADLRAALSRAAQDNSCRAILLTGAGRGFCAGQDLNDRVMSSHDGPVDLGDTIDRLYNPLVRQIRALKMPVICAVNGVAAGAGANLAFACDLVLAGKSAKFIEVFCRIGLIPDCGGSWTVTRLIGEARAKAMMLTGAPISAEQAADWGLIWRVVEDADLMNEAQSLTANLAAGPTIGLALTKQAIQAANGQELDRHLDLERDLQRQAGRTPDYQEGVNAFLEKRTPVFTGKSGRVNLDG